METRQVSSASLTRGRRPRGQVVVIFAAATFVLMLLIAVVIDVSWFWSNALRVQRAADAAALAGAVALPNAPGTGVALANAEAKRNGYVNGGGVTVAPAQDDNNPNRMRVLITAPVDTFFMRLIGISRINVSRTGVAEYNLPLKMGSPQNYYGVGRWMVPTISTNTVVSPQANTGFETTSDTITRDSRNRTLPDSQTWDGPPSNAENDENSNPRYATENANGDFQVWDSFGLQGGSNIPAPGTTTSGTTTTTVAVAINKVEVRLKDIHLTPTNTQASITNCSVRIEVFWNGGAIPSQARWLNPITQTLSSTNDQTFVVDVTAGVGWTYTDFSDQDFAVRLTWVEGTGCGSGTVDRGVALDALQSQVTYTRTTTTETKQLPTAQNILAPDGTALAPQNFWAGMQSYGAPSVQGDAYMTGYTTRTSATNPDYDPEQYYNYAVEIPPGASGGEVWIFDPEFCDTGVASNNVGEGAGDNWTVGGSNGASSVRYVNAYYELWNMKQTPYDRSDDVLLASSNNLFTGQAMNQSDQFLDGRNDAANSCEGKPYHAQTTAETRNKWWQLASGLAPGIYRVHTASRILSDPAGNQSGATGLNNFAIWTKTASGGAPKVYGEGTMEAYFGLPASQQSVFYMTQIDRQYAGKWIDIDLWDPGDTGDLTADLEILQPTSGGYSPASFYSNVVSGTSIPANFSCGPTTSSARTSIRTSNGDTSQSGIYNGQWLRLCLQIPANYTAPKPPGEPFDGGWYKIRYTMGSGSQPATDLTTWRVTIRDNPVHLVTP